MPITLATKVYTFSGFIAGRISQWINRDSGVLAGFMPLTNVIDAGEKSDQVKVRWKLKQPVVAEDASCACPGGMTHESFVDIVVTVHKGSSVAERTLLADSIGDLTETDDFRQSVISLVQASA